MPIFLEQPEPDYEPPFKEKVWCNAIKNRRMELGYDKASEFVRTLWYETRVKMHVQSYYKLEQGNQHPTISQFMAINLVLYNDYFPPKEVMQECVSEDFAYVKECLHSSEKDLKCIVPEVWGFFNYHDLEEKLPKDFENESRINCR